MFNKIKDFYNSKKKIVYIVVSSWFIFVVFIGVLIGLFSKPKLIGLSPEEENARSMKIIKGDDEKIYSGKILSTKNNLDFQSLEYSRNYIKSRNTK